MRISEIQVDLPGPNDTGGDRKPLAYLTIVFDNVLAIHNFRLIQLKGGKIILGAPSDEKRDPCPVCNKKNYIRHDWCGYCGAELDPRQERIAKLSLSNDGKIHIYSDVVHPIDNDFRLELQRQCVAAYEAKIRKVG